MLLTLTLTLTLTCLEDYILRATCDYGYNTTNPNPEGGTNRNGFFL